MSDDWWNYFCWPRDSSARLAARERLYFKYSDKWQLSCYSSLYLKLTPMLAFLSSSCKKTNTQTYMHIKPCASIWVDEWLHPWLLRLKYKSHWTLPGRLGLFWIWGITVSIAYWGVKWKMVQRCLVGCWSLALWLWQQAGIIFMTNIYYVEKSLCSPPLNPLHKNCNDKYIPLTHLPRNSDITLFYLEDERWILNIHIYYIWICIISFLEIQLLCFITPWKAHECRNEIIYASCLTTETLSKFYQRSLKLFKMFHFCFFCFLILFSL